MVNACCYALRTGCAGRLLPKTFPPWQAVYKAFSRWAGAGVFEAMHDRLRQQRRNRMGKAPANRCDHRFAKHPQHRAGWQHGVRRRQEGQGAQAPSGGQMQ
jgi:transposase